MDAAAVKRRLARGRWRVAIQRVLDEEVRRRRRLRPSLVDVARDMLQRDRETRSRVEQLRTRYDAVFRGRPLPEDLLNFVEKADSTPPWFNTTELFAYITNSFLLAAVPRGPGNTRIAVSLPPNAQHLFHHNFSQLPVEHLIQLVDVVLATYMRWVKTTDRNMSYENKLTDRSMMEMVRCCTMCWYQLCTSAELAPVRAKRLVPMRDTLRDMLNAIVADDQRFVTMRLFALEAFTQAYVAVQARNVLNDKELQDMAFYKDRLDEWYTSVGLFAYLGVLRCFTHADADMKSYILEYAVENRISFDTRLATMPLPKTRTYMRKKNATPEEQRVVMAAHMKRLLLRYLAAGIEGTKDAAMVKQVFTTMQTVVPPKSDMDYLVAEQYLAAIGTLLGVSGDRELRQDAYKILNDVSQTNDKLVQAFFGNFAASKEFGTVLAVIEALAGDYTATLIKRHFMIGGLDAFIKRLPENATTAHWGSPHFARVRACLQSLRSQMPDLFFPPLLNVLSRQTSKSMNALRQWVVLGRFFQPLDLFWHERTLAVAPRERGPLRAPQPSKRESYMGLPRSPSEVAMPTIGPSTIAPALLLEMLKSGRSQAMLVVLELICQLRALHAEHAQKRRLSDALSDDLIEQERAQVMDLELWFSAFLEHAANTPEVKLSLSLRTLVCQLLCTIRTMFANERKQDKDAVSWHVQEWVKYVIHWVQPVLEKITTHVNPTSVDELTELQELLTELERAAMSTVQEQPTAFQQLLRMRVFVLRSITQDWLTTCLETLVAATHRHQDFKHFTEAQLLDLFDLLWKATVPSPLVAGSGVSAAGGSPTGSMRSQRRGSVNDDTKPQQRKRLGSNAQMLTLPIRGDKSPSQSRRPTGEDSAGAEPLLNETATHAMLPYNHMVLLLFFCAEQLFLDDVHQRNNPDGEPSAHVLQRRQRLTQTVVRDMSDANSETARVQAINKLAFLFNFRSSLSVFDRSVKFFTAVIPYPPLNIGTDAVNKGVMPHWLKEIKQAAASTVQKISSRRDNEPTFKINVPEEQLQREAEMQVRQRLTTSLTQMPMNRTLPTVPFTETTKTVFPQLFTNVCPTLIDQLQDSSMFVRANSRTLLMNMMVNEPWLLLRSLLVDLTGDNAERQTASLIRLSLLVRSFDELPAACAFILFGHLLGIVKFYQNIESDDAATPTNRSGFRVIKALSPAQGQVDFRRRGVEIQAKVLPLLSVVVRSLHGVKYGEIKKDGLTIYLVTEGPLWYNVKKKGAMTTSGTARKLLPAHMFPAGPLGLGPATDISLAFDQKTAPLPTQVAQLFSVYQVRIAQLHFMRRLCARNPDEVSLMKTLLFHSPSGEPSFSQRIASSPLDAFMEERNAVPAEQHAALSNLELQRLRGWVRLLESMVRNFSQDNTFSQSDLVEINRLFVQLVDRYHDHDGLMASVLACCVTMASRFLPFFRTQGYNLILDCLLQLYISALQSRNTRVSNAVVYAFYRFYRLHHESLPLQALQVFARVLSEDASKAADVFALMRSLHEASALADKVAALDVIGVASGTVSLFMKPDEGDEHAGRFELKQLVQFFITAVAFEPFEDFPLKLVNMFRLLLPHIDRFTASGDARDQDKDVFFLRSPNMADVLLSSIVHKQALGNQSSRNIARVNVVRQMGRLMGRANATADHFREDALRFVQEFLHCRGRLEARSIKDLMKLLRAVMDDKLHNSVGVSTDFIATFVNRAIVGAAQEAELVRAFHGKMLAILDELPSESSISPLIDAVTQLVQSPSGLERPQADELFAALWTRAMEAVHFVVVAQSLVKLMLATLRRFGSEFYAQVTFEHLRTKLAPTKIGHVAVSFALELTDPSFASLEATHPGVMVVVWNSLLELGKTLALERYDKRKYFEDKSLAHALILLKLACLFAMPLSISTWRRVASAMEPVLWLPGKLDGITHAPEPAATPSASGQRQASTAQMGLVALVSLGMPMGDAAASRAAQSMPMTPMNKNLTVEQKLVTVDELYRWELAYFVCSASLPMTMYLRSVLQLFAAYIDSGKVPEASVRPLADAQSVRDEAQNRRAEAVQALRGLLQSDVTKQASTSTIVVRLKREWASLLMLA